MKYNYRNPSNLFRLTNGYSPSIRNQRGGTLPVFRGAPIQRGHGLGSLVKGLFRSAAPLLKKGAMALGKEAMETGFNIAKDVSAGQSIKSAAKRNVKKAGKRLATKTVKGIKNKMTSARNQGGGASLLLVRKVKRKGQKRKRIIRTPSSRGKRARSSDIFD
nr:TPA_asm: cupiennin [Strongylocentrotus sea urchin adintovirus]